MKNKRSTVWLGVFLVLLVILPVGARNALLQRRADALAAIDALLDRVTVAMSHALDEQNFQVQATVATKALDPGQQHLVEETSHTVRQYDRERQRVRVAGDGVERIVVDLRSYQRSNDGPWDALRGFQDWLDICRAFEREYYILDFSYEMRQALSSRKADGEHTLVSGNVFLSHLAVFHGLINDTPFNNAQLKTVYTKVLIDNSTWLPAEVSMEISGALSVGVGSAGLIDVEQYAKFVFTYDGSVQVEVPESLEEYIRASTGR